MRNEYKNKSRHHRHGTYYCRNPDCRSHLAERVKPEPTDYLTFEHVVYTGDSLWSLCERYSGYEDIQTIIERVRRTMESKIQGHCSQDRKSRSELRN